MPVLTLRLSAADAEHTFAVLTTARAVGGGPRAFGCRLYCTVVRFWALFALLCLHTYGSAVLSAFRHCAHFTAACCAMPALPSS